MSTPQHIVIIGGGLAGAKSAEALRKQGYKGGVTIVCAEPHLPYERPPLSKDFLAGKSEFAQAVVHPLSWYKENDIRVRQHTRATGVDPGRRQVTLDSGGVLSYDKLILATGSVARHLPLPGTDAQNVLYLRTVEESKAIRSHFGEGRALAIIGGGWIGLEVAAAARASGTKVTILEGNSLPLLNVLGPELARVFAKLHRDNGVDLRCDVRITEVVQLDGRATGVRLQDGEVIDADAVVIGIGVAPEIELARAAGLAMDNGVLVDATLRSSDPDIYAVGDIANHDHPVLGHRVRVEHWATALNQPATAVASILSGPTQYTELPYFFSDQFDLGMEYIGHAPNGSYDRIEVRGELEGLEFIAFWMDPQNRIKAAMNVNIWDVIEPIKKLIVSGRSVDPARLTNSAIDLDEV